METKIPVISVDQMREIDRLMVDEFGITIPQMMEIAGFQVAMAAKRMLKGNVRGKTILAASGTGNNGGDALVAARYLTNWGASVRVVVTNKNRLHEIPKKQLFTLEKMGIEIMEFQPQTANLFENIDIIIDGVIGYNLKGDPQNQAASLIRAINKSQVRVLSIDVPSGLDAQTGKIHNPCVKADTTLALSLPKKGTTVSNSQSVVGELLVADMSVPNTILQTLGIRSDNIFSQSPIIPYK